MYNSVVLSALVGAASVAARDIPSNVQSFYDSVKAKGACSNKLATGFYSKDDGPNTFSYCGDHIADYNVIYIKGSGTAFADMDIDCDGEQNGRGDDGRCGSSSDTQSITSFQDIVKGYKKGINDLNAYVHPYVVFGNEGTKSGWKTFDPEHYGIEPLSVIAVVCNGKMFYGIWGDENGDDGDKPMVGEASISMATACFGTSMNGNNGHDETDVLYIAFPGSEAVPGANGANWGATSWSSFESSLGTLGDKLVARIAGSSSGGGQTSTSTKKTTSTSTTKAPAATTTATTCDWPGHCLGASCAAHTDCSDPWACISGKCAVDPAVATSTSTKKSTTTTKPPAATTSAVTCDWPGHCLGASCSSNNDCSDPWACISGKCAVDPEVTVCEWEGHCLGASCSSNNDCSDPWACISGKCAIDPEV